MDDDLDDLLESGEQLRVSIAWLRQPIEGHVNTSLWRGDPNVFFFEADDGRVCASSGRAHHELSRWLSH